MSLQVDSELKSNTIKTSVEFPDMKLKSMRSPYRTPLQVLSENELVKDPFKIFAEWFCNASKCPSIDEPNAMCLATSTKDGYPSVRHVLMKDFSEKGFTFFTNYNSRKGNEMTENPNVALLFYWEPLKRAVRIEGKVNQIQEELSDEYFHSRPKESQLGACVSNQSTVIASRSVLDDELNRLKTLYLDDEVPRPKHWGGYVVSPKKIEFWQGQSNRLHDRIVFRQPNENEVPDGKFTHPACKGWLYERLSP